MADRKIHLSALGAYLLGYQLERLEWAIATIDDCTELASFFGDLRVCEEIHPFEEVGREAKSFHDTLSSLANDEILEKTKKRLL